MLTICVSLLSYLQETFGCPRLRDWTFTVDIVHLYQSRSFLQSTRTQARDILQPVLSDLQYSKGAELVLQHWQFPAPVAEAAADALAARGLRVTVHLGALDDDALRGVLALGAHVRELVVADIGPLHASQAGKPWPWEALHIGQPIHDLRFLTKLPHPRSRAEGVVLARLPQVTTMPWTFTNDQVRQKHVIITMVALLLGRGEPTTVGSCKHTFCLACLTRACAPPVQTLRTAHMFVRYVTP